MLIALLALLLPVLGIGAAVVRAPWLSHCDSTLLETRYAETPRTLTL